MITLFCAMYCLRLLIYCTYTAWWTGGGPWWYCRRNVDSHLKKQFQSSVRSQMKDYTF